MPRKPDHLRKPNKARGRPSPHRGKGPGLAWLKAHVAYEGEGCLIYPFSRNEKGYGQVGVNGKILKAHRVMCTLAHGEPPEPWYHAAHSCHKGHDGCVHPKHLDWKTPTENTLEAVEQCGGVIGGYRCLTIDQVDVIRVSDKTHAVLAAEFGVAVNTIGKIMRREIWVKPRSTITRAQIARIKDMDAGGMKVAEIARRAGVTYSTAWRMVHRKTNRDGVKAYSQSTPEGICP